MADYNTFHGAGSTIQPDGLSAAVLARRVGFGWWWPERPTVVQVVITGVPVGCKSRTLQVSCGMMGRAVQGGHHGKVASPSLFADAARVGIGAQESRRCRSPPRRSRYS